MNEANQTPQDKDTESIGIITSLQDEESSTLNWIKADILRLRKEGEIEEFKKQNPFPVEVFPTLIQDIINKTHKSNGFPIDYTAASLLYATAIAVGDTYKIQTTNGYNIGTVMYLAIVGETGVNKSSALSFAMEPLNKVDVENYKEYQKELKEYQHELLLQRPEGPSNTLSEKPRYVQHLVTDITPEALIEVRKHNPRGLGCYYDELGGLFNSFGRYNKGSEEEFWLSNFSEKTTRLNRKSGEPVVIDRTHISIGGTIQPGLLKELARGNRKDNGFLERFIFSYPDGIKKEYFNESDLGAEIADSWDRIIKILLMLDHEHNENGITPHIMRLDIEAKSRYISWYNNNVDRSEDDFNSEFKGIFAKMEQYCAKFILLIHLLKYACSETDVQKIDLDSVEKGIQLAEHFTRTSIKVREIILNITPEKLLPINKQRVYLELPGSFYTSLAIEVGKKHKISKSTIERFLKDKRFFKDERHGSWSKN